MKLLIVVAILLTAPGALACELSLVTPARSVLKKPVQAKAALADDTLTVGYTVSAPSLNARKVLGPQKHPYDFDVVELFVTLSETGFPYYEFEVSPYNEKFQVRIVSRTQPRQEGVDLGLVSTATILSRGWTAELKIPLKPLGWTAIPGRSAEISIPFSDALPVAIGVRSCQRPKGRTFISRSFFSRCCHVNSVGKETTWKGVIS
jgi:hypothetical protein